MLGDVGAAFDFLSKQKNVDPKRVGIMALRMAAAWRSFMRPTIQMLLPLD